MAKDIKQQQWRSLSEQEWRERLSDEAYRVLRQHGTERPFSGKYLTLDKQGNYLCAGCGQEIFSAASQFDAHCGWPSFDRALEGAIEYRQDTSHGMVRTEILCSRCHGHLGHVFDDGPTETGQRYCVNSVAMTHQDDV
ncbi:peptide-methionine (R)-S-oxide reductase MsrB [Idiomarina aquatica]|jgi:peptide-methionine (R)-S-oxide reductase|uniref:peptide-methionine (R)-S-oxide reductase MsrB n=1 Tax=Idiomarina aquatica TaxID=1327752 RepID=UPI0018E51AC7|nr:peptide-methionine (R)-S-oxide reductase MsrB [Idiomarina aquatica]